MEPVPIRYVTGDATAPIWDGAKIIVHVCNDIGGWGRGFVLALSARWVEPEREYLRWFSSRDRQGSNGGDFVLGAVQLVAVADELWVANLIGQRDIIAGPDGPPVRYDAIEEGLARVAAEASAMEASVHMPRIGCGLAGGDWDVVEGIIDRTLSAAGIPVVVYDL